MATLSEQITAIKTAMRSGALTVKHGDTLTTFRSLAEMKTILADMIAEQNAALGKTRNRVNYVKQCTKGL